MFCAQSKGIAGIQKQAGTPTCTAAQAAHSGHHMAALPRLSSSVFQMALLAKELLQRITRALQLVVRFAEAEADERARRVGGDVEGAHLCHTWCQL